MSEKLWSDERCVSILEYADTEITHHWHDSVTGLPCRGRADILFNNEKKNIVYDLKSTVQLTRFSHCVRAYDYDMQAAFYMDGFNADRFGWILVEKLPPHQIQIIMATDNQLDCGRKKYRDALNLYIQYREKNII